MLKHPTVFVVGAGASMPYDFQSGSGLLHEAMRQSPGRLRDDLMGLTEDQVLRFCLAMKETGEESIDAALEYHDDNVQFVGKKFIAARILEKERALLEKGDPAGVQDWIRFFTSRASEDVGSIDQFFTKNDIHFVTFNYDRVIEFKLARALKSKYAQPYEDWAGISERVIHLHGSLGSLEPIPGSRIPHVPFGGMDFSHESGPRFLLSCRGTSAQQIRIVHEARPDDECFRRARELMARARNVVFLGFGFAKTNVQRLDFSNIDQSAKVMATCKGMTLSQLQRRVHAAFKKHQIISGYRMRHMPDWGCLELLANYEGQLFAD